MHQILIKEVVVTMRAADSRMQQRICSELPFLFPLLLYGFLSMLSVQERAQRGGVCVWWGGLCFQGDGNTRLYTAAVMQSGCYHDYVQGVGLKEEGGGGGLTML